MEITAALRPQADWVFDEATALFQVVCTPLAKAVAVRVYTCTVDVLPGMNAGASTSAVPSPIEGSDTARVLLGSWALSPARPTPIHPRHECRGFSALLVTRSPYLVHNARNLYYALEYENTAQEVTFLSFAEYLASLRVPPGQEMGLRDFAQWFARHRAASRLKDPHALFEEFLGVITGPATDRPYLSREEYLSLGIRQSIFAEDERPHVYDLFCKYLAFIQDNNYYDPNILSHHYLPLVEPRYDFVVVDEVQDLTTIQLQLILTSLRKPHQFLLCGDANQIVHPNFFSWSTLKSFFYITGCKFC